VETGRAKARRRRATCAGNTVLYDTVPLGFVEGPDNKVRVLRERAYGLRDGEYLRLKVLPLMLLLPLLPL
jgi:transposase